MVQFALLALVATSAFTEVYWSDPIAGTLAIVGLVALGAGLMLLLLGVFALGRSLTPSPHPAQGGRLVERGVYGSVRHPIYGAAILICLGWSLVESPLGLVPTALLVVLFDLKARLEEDLLEERYPPYAGYRERTPWRFLPGLY
ncbi:MAG: isoprenylcysteine carboxylmethyltransferase family protein [Actinomycetota bacterium]|nr:isoprenylcysteine carboxylmethyltransferase family protein [Actinomycetota bacterium]